MLFISWFSLPFVSVLAEIWHMLWAYTNSTINKINPEREKKYSENLYFPQIGQVAEKLRIEEVHINFTNKVKLYYDKLLFD